MNSRVYPSFAWNAIFSDSLLHFRAQAKIALAGAFGSMFCTVGFVNAFGVFETYYAENQLAHQKETDIAWIGAINVFCIFAGSVFTGPLLDVSGPEVRRIAQYILWTEPDS